MRLINSTTLQLQEFVHTIPDYVILSHTWGDEEVSYRDMQGPNCKEMRGFTKIKNCCAQAAQDGFDYVWIDTCCIDKTSSAELSEAINSMYLWYKNARICYAYLEDVNFPYDESVVEPKPLHESRWFTRGWTLQELIAPAVVEFYNKNWVEIGTKISRQNEISRITGIDITVLRGDEPSTCNVAQRMSWASQRTTTRTEDTAYCLMGLFNVNMPLLYGEGGSKAFARLQEEIMKSGVDYTLFAWSAQETEASWSYRGLLASSPHEFGNPKGHLRRFWKYSDLSISSPAGFSEFLRIPGQPFSGDPPSLTSMGLRISLPLRRIGSNEEYLACLYCRNRQNNELLCIKLRRLPDSSLLYGRIMAHMVAMLPADQMTTFNYSTIHVTQAISNSARWRPRWSHEYVKQVFEIKLVPDPGKDIRILNVYPPSQDNMLNPSGARLILDQHHSSCRVVELEGDTLERFFISFGVLDGKNMPWCHLSTEFEMDVNGDWTRGSLSEYSQDPNAVFTDRIVRRLWHENIVIATARRGPYTKIMQPGGSLDVRGYTLTIYLKPELVGEYYLIQDLF